MKVRILKSDYAEIPVGTIGEFMGWNGDLAGVKVHAKFYTSGGKYEETSKVIGFFKGEFEEIPDLHTPQGPEILFLQALDWLATEAHATARDKGFWEERDALIAAAQQVGGASLKKYAEQMIASNLRELTISEIIEALEGCRKDLKDDKIPHFTMEEAEIADALIRIGDMIRARKLRVGEALLAKMRYNATRERKHGKQF